MKRKARALASFKDVQLAYLMEGVAAVEAMVKSKRASPSTIRRALKKLQEAGSDVVALERWVATHIGPIGRSRNAPNAGDVRSYKVQQVKGSGPFLRLPLDCLGVEKGSVIWVQFEGERIIVSK